MKKLHPITLLAGLISFMSILSCNSKEGSANKSFKFNPEKGKGYEYVIVWDDTRSIKQNTTIIHTERTISVKVVEDDGHVKTLSGTYLHFGMIVTMGNEKVLDINTANPSSGVNDPLTNNETNKAFAAFMGKPFTMKVDEEGKVLEMSGFNEMFQAVMKSLGMNKEEEQDASTRDMFGEERTKECVVPVFTIFPNKTIKPGDSWDKRYTIHTTDPANTYLTTYTVKGEEGGHVTLDAKSSVASEDGSTLKGDQSGTLIVDSKTGLVLSADLNGEFVTDMGGPTLKTAVKISIRGKEK